MPKHGKTKHRGLSRMKDGRWRLRVYATDPTTGRQKEALRTLPAEMSESDVLILAAQLRETLISQGPAQVRLTLASFAEQWIEAAVQRLRQSTTSHYADTLALRVLPQLGHVHLDELKREHIESWVIWAERAVMEDGRPFSKATIAGWWRVLCQFVRDACAQFSYPDPIVRVRAPRGRAGNRRERRTLTNEELGRLLEALEKLRPDRLPEVYFLAMTGMRPGELYALTWDDVDERRGRIVIRKAHRRGVVGPTKTDDPREVALTPSMSKMLQAQRRLMVATQHPGLASGLVFPADNGHHRLPESLVKVFRAAVKEARLDIRVGPQVLRRTFNTLMLEAGVDRIVLRSQMGHSSEEMTERYAGVPVEIKRAAVLQLEKRTR